MSEQNVGPNGPANLGVCVVGVVIALIVFASNPVAFIVICAAIGLLGALHFVGKF